MLHSFDREVAPRIREGFAGFSGFSSRQGEAQSQALSDMNVGANAQLASWQQGNQQLSASLAESAANRRFGAIGQAGLLANQGLVGAGALQQFYQPYQQRADQSTQAQYQEFLRLRPEANPWLSTAMSYVGQPNQIAYQPSGRVGSAFGGALGGGLTGGSLGMSALGFGTAINPIFGLGALLGGAAGFFG